MRVGTQGAVSDLHGADAQQLTLFGGREGGRERVGGGKGGWEIGEGRQKKC